MRIEHRHKLVQVLQQVVAEDERVRRVLYQLDLRRLDHDLCCRLHLDLSLIDLELDEIAAV